MVNWVQKGNTGKFCVITLNPLRMRITMKKHIALCLKDYANGEAFIICIGNEKDKAFFDNSKLFQIKPKILCNGNFCEFIEDDDNDDEDEVIQDYDEY
jgi:hypothetical protein